MRQLKTLIVRRAVFDMGSGQLKLVVADVDLQNRSIAKVLLSIDEKVFLMEDLQREGTGHFSQQAVAELTATMGRFKAQADAFHPAEYIVVATEAYRKALNGNEILSQLAQELSLPIRLISQHEEAHLGLLAAAHTSGIPLDRLLVWDIGGGSFQLTRLHQGTLQTYLGTLGRVTAKTLMLVHIQKKPVTSHASPNPVSPADLQAATSALISQLTPSPPWLQEALTHPDTILVGIGAQHPQITRLISRPTYTTSDVASLLSRYTSLPDSQIDPDPLYASFTVTGLHLVHTIMSHLAIPQVLFSKTLGLTPALLTCAQTKPHAINP